jgi:arylsulfatase A-like enzyme
MRRFRPFLISTFAALIGCGLTGCHAGGAAQGAAALPPYNVILVSLDTLRADRMGALGFHDWDITPNLDRLAREGVLFENAFSTASVTTASHMSMFTGLYPTEHRVSDVNATSPRSEVLPISLNPKIHTLPEILHSLGYHTARFVNSRDYFLDASIGFGRGFDELYPYGLDSRVAASAIASWFEANRDHRFFAFVHSKRPHGPYLFSKDVLTEAEKQGWLDKGYKGPVIGSRVLWNKVMAGKEWENNFIPGILPDCFFFDGRVRRNNADDLRRVRQLYSLGVHEADSFVGTVLESLAKNKLLDSTIVVVVSDHGEQLLEHGSMTHIHLFREETHVPFVLYLPPALRSAVTRPRVKADVQTVDILPTVLARLGLPAPKYLSGRDLAPLYQGKAESVRDFAMSYNAYTMIARSAAYRTPKWALVKEEGRSFLYDREKDPEERKDVASERSADLKAMEERLDGFELQSYGFDPDTL